eukprot:COSAG01_NODE_89_length_27311_cov_22.687061_18_plen_177_part_00
MPRPSGTPRLKVRRVFSYHISRASLSRAGVIRPRFTVDVAGGYGCARGRSSCASVGTPAWETLDRNTSHTKLTLATNEMRSSCRAARINKGVRVLTIIHDAVCMVTERSHAHGGIIRRDSVLSTHLGHDGEVDEVDRRPRGPVGGEHIVAVGTVAPQPVDGCALTERHTLEGVVQG